MPKKSPRKPSREQIERIIPAGIVPLATTNYIAVVMYDDELACVPVYGGLFVTVAEAKAACERDMRDNGDVIEGEWEEQDHTRIMGECWMASTIQQGINPENSPKNEYYIRPVTSPLARINVSHDTIH